jgi:iron complex transport system substrate-binding protein
MVFQRRGTRLYMRRHFNTGICIAVLLITAAAAAAVPVEIKYAEGFSIDSFDGYSLVSVYFPGSGKQSEPIEYVLIDTRGLTSRETAQVRERARAEHPAVSGPHVIEVPVDRCVLLSTTFIPPFSRFQALERIAGVDYIDNIYDSGVRQRLLENGAVEVGNGPGLDLELTIESRPQIVMVNLIEGEWNTAPKLEKAGITVVVNGDYLENSPLGRAEWIKFIALFLGKEEEARSWFSDIEERYLHLVSAVADRAGRPPSVVLNMPAAGRWVVPGGEGYFARFLEDARADYLWRQAAGTRSLVLDVETVFARALTADVWLHQYGVGSIDEIVRADSRLRSMKAVMTGRVANNDARTNSAGSNDFYESGPYRPDIILADLIAILHPVTAGELLPEHKLYYYRYIE